MELKIVLSANAGVSAEIGGHRFYIDALHNTPSAGFSALSDRMPDEFVGYAGAPDIILYTHLHPDHYSAELTDRICCSYPEAKLVMPEKESITDFGYASVRLIPLLHMGEYRDVPNFGIVIETAGKRLFFSGDSDPEEKSVLNKIEGLRPDFALLNFNWITLFSGRAALERLNPGHAAFVHLPYPEDDTEGYIRPTEHCRDRRRSEDAVMYRFLQTEVFDI